MPVLSCAASFYIRDTYILFDPLLRNEFTVVICLLFISELINLFCKAIEEAFKQQFDQEDGHGQDERVNQEDAQGDGES